MKGCITEIIRSKKYRVRINLPRDPRTGKRRVHTKTLDATKREVEAYVIRVIREVQTGDYVRASGQSLGAHIDEWMETVVRLRVKPRTHESYQHVIRLYIRDALGEVPLGKVTTPLVQALYAGLVTRGLSSNTVRIVHAILHSALRQAVRWNLLAKNPAHDITLPRRQHREPPWIDGASLPALLRECLLDEEHGFMFLLAIATGLRPGEYLGLKWPDLDERSGRIQIQRILSWSHGCTVWTFDSPKTSRARRTITMPSILIPILDRHKRRQVGEREAMGGLYQDHGLIFARPDGIPLESHFAARRLKGILRCAGLSESLRLYDLRHAFATLLTQDGEHARMLAQFMGHATTQHTMDTYSHVGPSQMDGVARRMDAILRKALPAGVPEVTDAAAATSESAAPQE